MIPLVHYVYNYTNCVLSPSVNVCIKGGGGGGGGGGMIYNPCSSYNAIIATTPALKARPITVVVVI